VKWCHSVCTRFVRRVNALTAREPCINQLTICRIDASARRARRRRSPLLRKPAASRFQPTVTGFCLIIGLTSVGDTPADARFWTKVLGGPPPERSEGAPTTQRRHSGSFSPRYGGHVATYAPVAVAGTATWSARKARQKSGCAGGQLKAQTDRQGALRPQPKRARGAGTLANRCFYGSTDDRLTVPRGGSGCRGATRVLIAAPRSASNQQQPWSSIPKRRQTTQGSFISAAWARARRS
jgi:hypothetical protein